MADNKDFPKTFKLAKAGDSAVVRFLHSGVGTIETEKTHWVQKGDTWKHFKCLGDSCPACAAMNAAKERAYIRLYNYTTNQVEVWDRTTNKKFFDELKTIEKDWGVLDDLVFRVTRDSDEFPTYSLMQQPSKNYEKTSDGIDEKIAYRMVANRSAEDIQTFLDTGVMPPKPQRVETTTTSHTPPETTYASVTNTNPTPPVYTTSNSSFVVDVDEDGDLPF